MSQLSTPVPIGHPTAPERIFMAPVTRSRADGLGVPGAGADCPALLP